MKPARGICGDLEALLLLLVLPASSHAFPHAFLTPVPRRLALDLSPRHHEEINRTLPIEVAAVDQLMCVEAEP